ncbi:MAG: hypothetical protein AAGG68_05155, partial [Bacteroidota bacterium]
SIAQSPNRKNALFYQAAIFDYYSPFSEDYLQPEGFQSIAAKIAYHRNLGGLLNLEIPFRLGGVRLPTPNDEFQEVTSSKVLTNIDALLQLQFFRSQ